MIPAPFRGSWCATDLGDYRPCRYTYERYPIESLPPLDETSFAGDFAWRCDLRRVLHEQVATMDRLAADLAESGLRLPADFVTCITRSNLYRCQYRCRDEVSCTCCCTTVEVFAYRFWTENSLWLAIHDSQPIKHLNALQCDYIEHHKTARQDCG